MADRSNSDRVYLDASRPVAERVGDLLGRMTLPEKAGQLMGHQLGDILAEGVFNPDRVATLLHDGAGHLSKVGGATGLEPAECAALTNKIQRVLTERTRLQIPAIVHEEALGGFQHRGATVFPQGLGLASSWSPEVVEQVGEVIRVQMRAVGATQCLAPVLDVVTRPSLGPGGGDLRRVRRAGSPDGRRVRAGAADRRSHCRGRLHSQALPRIRGASVGGRNHGAGSSRSAGTARRLCRAVRGCHTRGGPAGGDEQLLVDRRGARRGLRMSC